MRVTTLAPGLAVGIALLLAGCGSDDAATSTSTTGTAAAAPSTTTGAGTASPTASAPTTEVAPGDGDAITGTGYATEVPRGWKDAAKLTEGTAFKVDRLYATANGRSNVVILRETPAGLEGKSIQEIDPVIRKQSAAAVNVATPDADAPTTLDGEDAIRWTFRRKQGPRDLVQRNLSALHDGALYTITLTSQKSSDDGERALATVRSAWRWK